MPDPSTIPFKQADPNGHYRSKQLPNDSGEFVAMLGGRVEMTANRGVANGYASLDSSVKVPLAQIPDAILGDKAYQGAWNAAANTPVIPTAAPGNKGWYYSVSVAGTTPVNGISSWAIGDEIISNGAVWQKIPSTTPGNSDPAVLTNKTINGANNTLTVRLANDVTGNLPVTNLNSGTGATSSSFWRGDGQWAPPAGGGDVVGPAASVDGELPLFSGTTGKIVKRCNLSGFVKATSNGSATAQSTMGTADIATGAVDGTKIAAGSINSTHPAVSMISGQPEKTTAADPDDQFLIVDKVTGQLRMFRGKHFSTPPGAIMDYAGSIEPDGWLFCFGQAKARVGTYANLFAAIGVTWGAGDGSTTFNVPDFRGRVCAGKDDMGGTSANRLTAAVNGNVLGGVGGAETHVLTIAELANHQHLYSLTQFVGGGYGAAGSYWAPGTTPTASGSTGSGTAHNNVQPTGVCNKIIKY